MRTTENPAKESEMSVMVEIVCAPCPTWIVVLQIWMPS